MQAEIRSESIRPDIIVPLLIDFRTDLAAYLPSYANKDDSLYLVFNRQVNSRNNSSN